LVRVGCLLVALIAKTLSAYVHLFEVLVQYQASMKLLRFLKFQTNPVSPRNEAPETRTRVLDEEVKVPDVTEYWATANQPLPHSSEDMLE
jgi:hypothetical protein